MKNTLRTALVIIALIVVLGIVLVVMDKSPQVAPMQPEENHAIDLAKENEYVQMLDMDQVETDVREVSISEQQEYPVIYKGTSGDVRLVTFQEGSRGVVCVVDDAGLKRCFNSINFGSG